MEPTISVEPRSLGIALGSPVLSQCAIAVSNVTGTSVDVNYQSLGGNQPQQYGNFVAIWEGSVIPWTVAPMRRMVVPDNFEDGSITIDQIRITRSPYTVGYATGPNIADICASQSIGAGGQPGPGASLAIRINHIGTTSLSVHYATLGGYLPFTNKNWIGLWTGQISPYNAPSALARVPIPTDVTEGDVGINGVQITIATTYTLVYFMSALFTSAAALLTFSTSDG